MPRRKKIQQPDGSTVRSTLVTSYFSSTVVESEGATSVPAKTDLASCEPSCKRKRATVTGKMVTIKTTATAADQRTFQHQWQSNNPWLKYDAVRKAMFCTLFLEAGMTNTFTEGCTMIKKDNVTKHGETKGKNGHKNAVIAVKLKTNMVNANRKAVQRNEQASIAFLRNVYWMAKTDSPNSLMKDLNELLKLQVRSKLFCTITNGYFS